ncbi:hypothetical protein [Janthinobacterium lividum]|uniref:hypothetical protein n=1 Tax=Janthinobacterium lividum TaxID=29581 RepID=UPI00087398F8|nr:hypothetical protein [Janthinobacterium lividum]MCC7714258.1 hypothetical protein [Janthinobacterium lividum]OEZ46958.1 hypothetical protein JANLI_55930 [Janthinobacterium lividum]WQE27815.1 hypothetical protein U0004_22950 [Janthinobacterium lividum]STQ98734.1 Uncharacterised protein [Janthinobacterium lividum]
MDDARRQQLTDIVAAKAGVDVACAARHLALHDGDVAAALRGIDVERYTLTQRLLNKYRRDPEDALQHVALAVLQQEGIRSDSVLRLERIAALAPPVAGMVMLAEWLAYVDWEGFDSALYVNIDAVAAIIAGALGLPEVAANLLQTRDEAVFETQRPALAAAALLFIERHTTQFP